MGSRGGIVPNSSLYAAGWWALERAAGIQWLKRWSDNMTSLDDLEMEYIACACRESQHDKAVSKVSGRLP